MRFRRLIRLVVAITFGIAGYTYLNGVENGEKRYVTVVRKYTGFTLGPSVLPDF
jgi:hypothetical protein